MHSENSTLSCVLSCALMAMKLASNSRKPPLVHAHHLCQVKGLVCRVVFGCVTCVPTHCPRARPYLDMGVRPWKVALCPRCLLATWAGKGGPSGMVRVGWLLAGGAAGPLPSGGRDAAHQGSSACRLLFDYTLLTSRHSLCCVMCFWRANFLWCGSSSQVPTDEGTGGLENDLCMQLGIKEPGSHSTGIRSTRCSVAFYSPTASRC